MPYIPFGPFQIRLPFIHYKIESVEFIQGLILGVTALAAVPYLEQYLGLPYELAWSCVIIETFLYLLHSLHLLTFHQDNDRSYLTNYRLL